MRRALIGLAAAALALCLAAPANAAAIAWTRQLVPLPRAATSGDLLAVSCESSTHCVAVGYVSPGREKYTEIARWDGTDWSSHEVPVPGAIGSGLLGVSCASADCVAVGVDHSPTSGPQPLALRRHGGRWAQQALPVPSGRFGELTGVSCVSTTSCFAVGDIAPSQTVTVAFAEHWDGSRWTEQSIPTPPGATGIIPGGVSCVSDTSCTMVGSLFSSSPTIAPVAEHWDGSRWTVQSTPSPAGSGQVLLNAVSCVSDASCTAVGESTAPGATGLLAEHWDGSAWSIQPVPGASPARLLGVSCVSAAACTAVGSDSKGNALAEFWNGSAWRRQPTAQPVVNLPLQGISCTSAHHCLAVGRDFVPPAGDTPVAEREQ